MRHSTNQRILNRGILNGQEAPKEMFNIFSHQGNANQNDSEIPPYTHLHLAKIKKKKKKPQGTALEAVKHREHSSSAGRVQTCTTTLEINLAVS
jgi:hypothetical protein